MRANLPSLLALLLLPCGLALTSPASPPAHQARKGLVPHAIALFPQSETHTHTATLDLHNGPLLCRSGRAAAAAHVLRGFLRGEREGLLPLGRRHALSIVKVGVRVRG